MKKPKAEVQDMTYENESKPDGGAPAQAPQVMLITGARKGIGRSLAEHYLNGGYLVAGCSRESSDLVHERYWHLQADVADEAQVIEMVTSIKRRWGRLDILINNAGTAAMNHTVLTPWKTADHILSTNFAGTFLCSREAAKLMMRSRWGRIVNLSTIAVPLRIEGEAVYAASKSAVETFTRVLAKELAPFGITCNAVGPTPIETDLIRGVPRAKIDRLIEQLPLQRLGAFADVANVVDFFISERSDYITGQVLYLGGA
ncbi:SDR family NAD(P)-dependent oxidoreductase [Heliomicrobium gestii]|nr:SDR family oxidoreductase [Heliomicrobium gestii]MBM7866718.1 3-oxoacyl-[acyl-carrier protein] reductase [Heliomicrobium gestii]